MKRKISSVLLPAILLLCLLAGGCANSNASKQKELEGKWNLASMKISRDFGETWKTIPPYDALWIEFCPEGEFRMRDQDMGGTLQGEWRVDKDSVFYIIPSLSAMPGMKCNGKIVRCDDNLLVIEQTYRDGVSQSYYSRE